MRVISLVVEGFERAAKQGLLDWLMAQDADIICLQDTQCSEYSLTSDDFFPREYNAYFLDNFDDHRVNGVAIYCRQLPKAIMTGLGFADFDSRGLYIQADYSNYSIGSLLMPSGISGDGAMNTKLKFMDQLGSHLQKVRNKRREFILCGGWELVAKPIDAEESGNRVDIAGFSDIESGWLSDLYKDGYCDAFRAFNSDPMNSPGGPRAMMRVGFAPTPTSSRQPCATASIMRPSTQPMPSQATPLSSLTTTSSCNHLALG